MRWLGALLAAVGAVWIVFFASAFAVDVLRAAGDGEPALGAVTWPSGQTVPTWILAGFLVAFGSIGLLPLLVGIKLAFPKR